MRTGKSDRLGRAAKWPALLGAAAAAIASAALAAPPATQPTVEDLMRKIDDLQNQVQQMKQTQTQQQALSQQEVDATVDRVLADADKRSQLLENQGFTAGWDHGKFIIKSEDGNFLLHPCFQLQIRDGTSFRDHQQPGGGDDTQNGFEIRRTLAA